MATKKTNNQGTILYRSESNKMLGGVCGGLGEVFDLDPTIIRVLFLVALFFGGSGFLLYIILWVVIPTRSKVSLSANDSLRENVEEMKAKAHEFGDSFKKHNDDSRKLFGAIIVLLGVMFLFSNFGFLSFFNLHRLWPVILIVVGFYVVVKHNEKR